MRPASPAVKGSPSGPSEANREAVSLDGRMAGAIITPRRHGVVGGSPVVTRPRESCAGSIPAVSTLQRVRTALRTSRGRFFY